MPKNYGDLLRPELKGKIGFVSNETGTRTLGGILKVKGEEFVRKLKVQDISLHPISGRAMADLVMSGEVALSPTIFRDHALEAKAKGAPIDWAPMEIVPANAGGVALVAQAPHPHAAALLADFLLSAEAAKILGDLDYGSPFKPVSFKLWYPESRTVDGAIRQSRREVGQAVARNRPQTALKSVSDILPISFAALPNDSSVFQGYSFAVKTKRNRPSSIFVCIRASTL